MTGLIALILTRPCDKTWRIIERRPGSSYRQHRCGQRRGHTNTHTCRYCGTHRH